MKTQFKVDREELAWCAGFFDGEGHARYQNTATRGLRICVGQKDRVALDRFKRALSLGSVNGPYGKPGRYAASYQFSVNGFEQVQAVIAVLWRKLGTVK